MFHLAQRSPFRPLFLILSHPTGFRPAWFSAKKAGLAAAPLLVRTLCVLSRFTFAQ
ncbi:hypothetical protein B4113_3219 [Geobacillus sp. B4113_201601]|nr:hypothetical protein B4113_3219 [Geobacillus sp. B4113_201601]